MPDINRSVHAAATSDSSWLALVNAYGVTSSRRRCGDVTLAERWRWVHQERLTAQNPPAVAGEVSGRGAACTLGSRHFGPIGLV
jgi:hypothetical protein